MPFNLRLAFTSYFSFTMFNDDSQYFASDLTH